MQTIKIIPTEGVTKGINESLIHITDSQWEALLPFLESPSTEIMERFKHTSIAMSGYFQISEPLMKFRPEILELLSSYGDLVLTKSGHTLKEVLAAQPRMDLQARDIVVHLRIGDYRTAGFMQDPAPVISILRRLRAAEPSARVILVSETPRTPAERNYLLLFEEFQPILQHGTDLEDFATLRAARRLIVCNSTFSWFAAYLGDAEERWIPEPTFNELGAISENDHMYKASTGYDMSALDIPEGDIVPVTGEFLQSLCDYTIIDDTKRAEFHKWIDVACPRERQLRCEEAWPATVVANARSVFVYPEKVVMERFMQEAWPALRLVVIHNGDNSVNPAAYDDFLKRHPRVWIWQQNLMEGHERVRVIPILEQNRMWRGGREDWDPPVSVYRGAEREAAIVYPFCSATNPLRAVWAEEAAKLCRGREDFVLYPYRLPKEDYEEALQGARAVVCPPGNGVDTHRHWETLYKGGWAIVQDNAHTKLLLEAYPSLPLLPITGPADLVGLQAPAAPSPFHPMLLREYWRVLHQSFANQE